MEQRTYALGERYIGAGKRTGKIELYEVPGNALGTYLDGAEIVLHANAQDATGDTMNAGEITIYGFIVPESIWITIYGSTGDAAGYAMRGGSIYVQGDAGYRAGIHMKAYEDKVPVLVIGGRAGSFLGEYQAGGVIVVLGIGSEDRQPVGNFCGTGMHGGRIFLRTEHLPKDLPQQVIAEKASAQDMEIAAPLIRRYCEKFGADAAALLGDTYYMLRPNSKNPYKQLYVTN